MRIFTAEELKKNIENGVPTFTAEELKNNIEKGLKVLDDRIQNHEKPLEIFAGLMFNLCTLSPLEKNLQQYSMQIAEAGQNMIKTLNDSDLNVFKDYLKNLDTSQSDLNINTLTQQLLNTIEDRQLNAQGAWKQMCSLVCGDFSTSEEQNKILNVNIKFIFVAFKQDENSPLFQIANTLREINKPGVDLENIISQKENILEIFKQNPQFVKDTSELEHHIIELKFKQFGLDMAYEFCQDLQKPSLAQWLDIVEQYIKDPNFVQRTIGLSQDVEDHPVVQVANILREINKPGIDPYTVIKKKIEALEIFKQNPKFVNDTSALKSHITTLEMKQAQSLLQGINITNQHNINMQFSGHITQNKQSHQI